MQTFEPANRAASSMPTFHRCNKCQLPETRRLTGQPYKYILVRVESTSMIGTIKIRDAMPLASIRCWRVTLLGLGIPAFPQPNPDHVHGTPRIPPWGEATSIHELTTARRSLPHSHQASECLTVYRPVSSGWKGLSLDCGPKTLLACMGLPDPTTAF